MGSMGERTVDSEQEASEALRTLEAADAIIRDHLERNTPKTIEEADTGIDYAVDVLRSNPDASKYVDARRSLNYLRRELNDQIKKLDRQREATQKGTPERDMIDEGIAQRKERVERINNIIITKQYNN